MTRFYIFFFTLLTLFSLYATLYGSVLDNVSYKRNYSSSSSSSHTYSSSARSSSSSHSYGNGGYSSGK